METLSYTTGIERLSCSGWYLEYSGNFFLPQGKLWKWSGLSAVWDCHGIYLFFVMVILQDMGFFCFGIGICCFCPCICLTRKLGRNKHNYGLRCGVKLYYCKSLNNSPGLIYQQRYFEWGLINLEEL